MLWRECLCGAEKILSALVEGLIMSSIYAGGYDLVTGGKAFGGDWETDFAEVGGYQTTITRSEIDDIISSI